MIKCHSTWMIAAVSFLSLVSHSSALPKLPTKQKLKSSARQKKICADFPWLSDFFLPRQKTKMTKLTGRKTTSHKVLMDTAASCCRRLRSRRMYSTWGWQRVSSCSSSNHAAEALRHTMTYLHLSPLCF